MYDSNFKLMTSVLTVCVLLSACAPNSKSASPDPESVKISTDLVCQDKSYDVISKSMNLDQMKHEADFPANTLSGAAVGLNGLLMNPKLIEKSTGLSQACHQDYLALEVTCKGDIKVTSSDKVETLTQDQLVAKSPLYVKSATFCGALNLKQSEVLYVVADQITFQNLSVGLEKEAILSLSAREVLNGSHGLLSLHQEAGSAVMIHAYTLK